jgi:glycosyltransferase involved in cell wall biosynthesis
LAADVSKSSSRPRILYLTPVWPNKGAIGVHMRSMNVLRALQNMGPVEVAILGDEYKNGDAISQTGDGMVAHSLDVELRPNKGLFRKLEWTLDPKSNYPNGCRVEAAAMRGLLSRLDDFDLVWFFKPRTADMFPNAVWPRSVLDVDDVPSKYEGSNLKAGNGVIKRFYTVRRLLTWKRREKLLGGRFTVLTVCSEEDKQYLESIGIKGPIRVIPNGFELPKVEPIHSPVTPPRIGFIGLLDYLPNSDGINWFVKNCWPIIKTAVPEARLRMVGPGTDGPLKPQGPDIDGLGWVDNPADEIKTWSLMSVPIRIGGGTRIKIAQGFSQKCPIVSTSLGARGYQPTNGNEMYLADSAEDFASACIKTIREPEKSAEMAERAWRQFLEKWTWDAIQPLVWAAAEDCLRLNGRSFPKVQRQRESAQQAVQRSGA